MQKIHILLLLFICSACSVRTSEKQALRRYVKYPPPSYQQAKKEFGQEKSFAKIEEKSIQVQDECHYLPASDDPNFVYFTIASAQELKKEAILDASGNFMGFSEEGMANGFDGELFVAIKKMETQKIPLPEGQIKLATNHPKTSYAIGNGSQHRSLKIIDPLKFWEYSRYSVIVIE